MMIEKIAQEILDDRGEMFSPNGYTLEDIRLATEMAVSEPVQYIQYRWDNARGEVIEFYSYSPEEWETWDLLPNMQRADVLGRPISQSELEAYLKDRLQPSGAAFI